MLTVTGHLNEQNPDNTCPELSEIAEKAPRFSESAETVYYEEKIGTLIKYLFRNLPEKVKNEAGT